MPTSLGIALIVFLSLHQFSRLHPVLGLLSTWPSTVLHELAHFVLALLLGAQPSSISVWPKRTGPHEWQLGSVTFVPSFWTASWVALAPLGWAVLALVICTAQGAGDPLETVLRGLLCGVLLQASVPSSADWGIAVRYPGGLACMLVLGGLGLSAVN